MALLKKISDTETSLLAYRGPGTLQPQRRRMQELFGGLRAGVIHHVSLLPSPLAGEGPGVRGPLVRGPPTNLVIQIAERSVCIADAENGLLPVQR
jgi:hypothetical protein